MGKKTVLEDGRIQYEWDDPSPSGMFQLGWLAARIYEQVNLQINCNIDVKIRISPAMEVNNTINLKPTKAMKYLPASPVTIIGVPLKEKEAGL